MGYFGVGFWFKTVFGFHHHINVFFLLFFSLRLFLVFAFHHTLIHLVLGHVNRHLLCVAIVLCLCLCTRMVANITIGYITGDSARSDVSRSVRPMGPFQSAKAKSRNRSQSANTLSTNILAKASQIRQTPRESRSRFRTPQTQRIQTMSADRSIGPVTPKVQHGQKVAMLRYAKQGETVISLGGSPVVASRLVFHILF